MTPSPQRSEPPEPQVSYANLLRGILRRDGSDPEQVDQFIADLRAEIEAEASRAATAAPRAEVGAECGECGHDANEHVHYCSHEEASGSCDCNAEYALVDPDAAQQEVTE